VLLADAPALALAHAIAAPYNVVNLSESDIRHTN
jgi:hypothetical protein